MASCNDCIHSKVCEFFSYRITSNAEQKCKHFKDRSRFVELPFPTRGRHRVVADGTEVSKNA